MFKRFFPQAPKKFFQSKKVLTKKNRFQPKEGWSQQHHNIFNALENTKNNLAIEACAGSGKTTLLTELNYRLLEQNPKIKILDIAFNSEIARELVSRLPEESECRTVHAFGKKIVDKVLGKGKKINVDINNVIAYNLAVSLIGPEDEKEEERWMLIKAFSLAKDRLVGLDFFQNRKNDKNLKEDSKVIEEIITLISPKYNIETNYDKEIFAHHVLKMMILTQDNLLLANNIPSISFADMIWLPIVNSWEIPTYDVVLIDEAQDISKARAYLANKARGENGRMIICFDRYQAIYGFAGADTDTAIQLVDYFNAKVFPLSVSYRCAQNIIIKAKEFNSLIEAHHLAPLGQIDSAQLKLLSPKIGDAILSRKNAPLIKLFFQLAKRGIPVAMLGKDYWAMLQLRVLSWEPSDLESVLDMNDAFFNQRAKFLREKNQSISRLKDECETIEFLVKESLSLSDLFKNLRSIKESSTKDFNTKCVTLSSVHKAKGLEWDHVHIILETFSLSSQEEINLNYVAVTRAKNHLTYLEN